MLKVAGFRVIQGPSKVGRVYQQAISELQEEGFDIELRYVQPPAEGMPMPPGDWLQYAREEADVVFFSFPVEFKALHEFFASLKEELEKPLVPVTPESSAHGSVPSDAVELAVGYHFYGGRENLKDFLCWLGILCGKHAGGQIKPPRELPWAGIYHPKAPSYFTSLEEYLDWYGERAPLVGLIFPRVFWVEENLKTYNAVIGEIENRGGGAVAVFSDGWFGKVKNDEVIRRFFFRDDRTVVQAVLAYGAFFLKTKREAAAMNRENSEDILRELNVPFLEIVSSSQTEEEWEADPQGLNLRQVIISLTLPEFDGLVEPVLVGVNEDDGQLAASRPLTEQVRYLADRLFRWMTLRSVPNREKRVAFVLLNSPCKSVEATVGTAFGLDSLESVARILQRMKEEGYSLDWVPADGKELADRIMDSKALPDFRWTTIEEIVSRGGAAGRVPLKDYQKRFASLPAEAREKVKEAWGDPEAVGTLEGVEKLSLGLHRGEVVVPGLVTGNVFIGVQPKRGCAGSRCDGEVCKILHDPDIPPPHQWLAWHQWLEEDFGADVVVHVGTHGVLELLPGKTVCLSPSCFPRISLGKIPHLYIYNLVNPMEAIIAKRRGSSVIIDHLPPVLASMELSGDLADLEELLEDYQKAVEMKEKARMPVLAGEIEEKARRTGLLKEGDAPDPALLHEKLTLLRESQFRDGLHIFGQAPEGKMLAEMLNYVLRLDQPDCPGLRRALSSALEVDYETLLNEPEKSVLSGMTGGRLLEELDSLGRKILVKVSELPAEKSLFAVELAAEMVEEFALRYGLSTAGSREPLSRVVEKALQVVSLVRRTGEEMTNLLRGFHGEFIEPGASGALARGKVEVLPTGRNMYSIDPWRIPTAAAWTVGMKLADDLIAHYMGEEKGYPESIGFTLRAMDPFRADGELIAQILYTVGVEPVWVAGRVVSLKPIPLQRLGRPRIDCTVNLSSILRDGMPRAFELIDEAVQLVAALPEKPEENYVRKHVLEREKALEEEGCQEEERRRLATMRIFSSAPGTYGTGVELAVASSSWQDEKDLAGVYFHWTGYAYGAGMYARKAPEELVESCRRVKLTFEKFDSDEIDLLDCCHIYGVHGGFTVAAQVASGKEVKSLFGDTRDPAHPSIRSLREELSRIAHTRLLNPAWIEGKKRHGYKGAGDISSRVNHMYGWQATTRQVENWVFDGIAETFILDAENRKFFGENNPWALEEIARRLLEAQGRELWQPREDVLDALKEMYLEIEGWLEERMGDKAKGGFQGGAVRTVVPDVISDWSKKLGENVKKKEGSKERE
jgi:cobaltochelatase CobN